MVLNGMWIIESKDYTIPILLKDEQLNLVSSAEKIQNSLKADNCLGFYAYEESTPVGFALLRKFEENQFFLWDFLIDHRYQGCGKGKMFLRILIDKLKKNYLANVITTTYIYCNEIAKKLYEAIGFTQTDIIDESNIHEVNMELLLKNKTKI
jgi:diamine N-acetyltransferase